MSSSPPNIPNGNTHTNPHTNITDTTAASAAASHTTNTNTTTTNVNVNANAITDGVHEAAATGTAIGSGDSPRSDAWEVVDDQSTDDHKYKHTPPTNITTTSTTATEGSFSSESTEVSKSQPEQPEAQSESKSESQPVPFEVRESEVCEEFKALVHDGVRVTDDGQLIKLILQEAPSDSPTPPVMSRAFVLTKGSLLDGHVFLDSTKEELDFIVGRGEVATGLQMSVVDMRCGERALVLCGPKYGYSSLRRPAGLAPDVPIVFQIELRRFEQEKSAHEMSPQDKIDYATKRREVGKLLFSEGRVLSALKQYERALTVLDEEEFKDSDLLPAVKQLKAVHLANSALIKLKLQEFSTALAFCNQSLALDKSNIKVLLRRAEVQKHLHNYEESKTDLLNALELGPDNSLLPHIRKELALLEQRLREQLQKQRAVFGGVFNRGSLYDDKPTPPPNTASRVREAVVRGLRTCSRAVCSPVSRVVQTLRSLCRSKQHKQHKPHKSQ